MKKLFIILGLIVSAAAFAADSTESVRFTPCNYWSYSSDARGYICSSTGMPMTIPDQYEMREMERTIQEMDRRLRALEQRIKELEAK